LNSVTLEDPRLIKNSSAEKAAK